MLLSRILVYSKIPVVLYEYEIWSLLLSDEAKFKIFENRALKTIHGSVRGVETKT